MLSENQTAWRPKEEFKSRTESLLFESVSVGAVRKELAGWRTLTWNLCALAPHASPGKAVEGAQANAGLSRSTNCGCSECAACHAEATYQLLFAGASMTRKQDWIVHGAWGLEID